MSWNPGCGCGNWWDNFPRSICGSFELPDGAVEDQGRCSSRHVKTTCEAPALPIAQCADETYSVLYQPENTANPFVILAKLFDECCAAITDQSGNSITLVISQMGGYADGVCDTPVVCPAIRTQPQTVDGAAPQTFSVTLDSEPVGTTYQWQFMSIGWADITEGQSFNGGTITGTTTTDLLFSGYGPFLGDFTVRCIISCPGCDDLTSDSAILTFGGGPPLLP